MSIWSIALQSRANINSKWLLYSKGQPRLRALAGARLAARLPWRCFPERLPGRAQYCTVSVSIRPFNLGEAGSSTPPLEVETEPNDTPGNGSAAHVACWAKASSDCSSARGADDIEYFDNGKVGNSGDDWFRFTYEGQEPRLLTCSLAIPDQTLAARLRLYALDAKDNITAQQLLSKPATIRSAAADRGVHRRPKRERKGPSTKRGPPLGNQPPAEAWTDLLPAGRSQCARLRD